MNEFAPLFEVTRDDIHSEVHWVSSGTWTTEQAKDLLRELRVTSLPFIESNQKFRVLGDLREFQVQSQEVADIMVQSQQGALSVGVDKMAIVHSSTLVKIQFRRISEGRSVEFFEDKQSALDWLRMD
jgi:hypothetical protein